MAVRAGDTLATWKAGVSRQLFAIGDLLAIGVQRTSQVDVPTAAMGLMAAQT